jgi:hypothetical protein
LTAVNAGRTPLFCLLLSRRLYASGSLFVKGVPLFDRDNQFFGFCTALCNKSTLEDYTFEGFLDALRPVYPTINPSDISDQSSIDRLIAQFNQSRDTRLQRISDYAQFSGHFCSTCEIQEVFDWMHSKGISDSDCERVFRRWREKTTPRSESVPALGFSIDDMTLTSPLAEPLINNLIWDIKVPTTNPCVDYLSGIEEFDKAVRWVRRRTRISKATAAWHKCMSSLPQMSLAFLIQMFWLFLPWVILAAIVAMWHSVSAIHGIIFLQFAGMAIGITTGVDLLIWGFVKASTVGGSAIDPTHEWRIRLPNGKPGARVKPGTMKDLYEHTHGHGSWERRNTRIKNTGTVLACLTILACPLLEIPFLQNAGVQGIGSIIGYFLVYPLLPLAVLGGLIFGLYKLSPPLKIQ